MSAFPERTSSAMKTLHSVVFRRIAQYPFVWIGIRCIENHVLQRNHLQHLMSDHVLNCISVSIPIGIDLHSGTENSAHRYHISDSRCRYLSTGNPRNPQRINNFIGGRQRLTEKAVKKLARIAQGLRAVRQTTAIYLPFIYLA